MGRVVDDKGGEERERERVRKIRIANTNTPWKGRRVVCKEAIETSYSFEQEQQTATAGAELFVSKITVRAHPVFVDVFVCWKVRECFGWRGYICTVGNLGN